MKGIPVCIHTLIKHFYSSCKILRLHTIWIIGHFYTVEGKLSLTFLSKIIIEISTYGNYISFSMNPTFHSLAGKKLLVSK